MSKTPKLRFKEFSGDWEQKKLGDECNFFSGGTPLTTNRSYYDGNIPFIRSAELSEYTTELKISQDGLNNSSAKLVQKGDLLYALYGATSGAVSISKIDGAINQAILCIKSDNINLEFLEKILIKNKENIIKTYLQGGQGNLSSNIIKGLKYNLPSKEEQEKIASFLSLIDDKISLQGEKVEALKDYKKGMMQKIFSRKLRFKDDDGRDYPEWEEKKLVDIAECLDNKRKPLNSKERVEMKGSIPYYGANGVVDFVNDYIFDEDIILLAEDGGNFDDFATKPIAQFVTGKSWVNNHAHVLRAKYNAEFLFYSLVHKDIRKYINGTSRAKLNKSDMLDIVVNVPKSLKEQKKIADTLRAIYSKIEKEQEKLDYLNEYKKGLLQQMFV